MNKFSLIVPCYQEEPHLAESTQELRKVLLKQPFDIEIIFVDDGSTDNTRDVIEALCNQYPECRYIFHKKNRGRGAAFKTGFKEAQGDLVGFVDIDLEIAAHYIPPILDKLANGTFDVVTGHRYYMMSQIKSIHRLLLSHGYRTLCNLLLNLGLKDTESGCKFFKKDTTETVILESTNDSWFWDTEVMARAKLAGLKIHEMPVLFLRRLDKQSTVKIVKDTIDYFCELRNFRKEIGFSLFDRSPIYWSDKIYSSSMKFLFGSRYEQSFIDSKELIPDGASVVDLCFGTKHFFEQHLKTKISSYIGIDYNGRLVLAAQNAGIDARMGDILTIDIPEADVIVMNSSLYHFRAHEDELLRKLKSSASKVILSEPTENLSSHQIGLVRRLAEFLSKPGKGEYTFRYSPDSFREFAEKHGAIDLIENADSRNSIAVFKGDL